MATYVMSDIHGCFDEFQRMLDKIGLSDDDRLILAGDYMDRGDQCPEMMKWLENRQYNVIPIKGNHDVEFIEYVKIMQQIDWRNQLMTNPDSNEDTKYLLDSVYYIFKHTAPGGLLYFDCYGCITDMIEHKGVTLGDLTRWKNMIEEFPYYQRFGASDRDCVVVHAGFCEDEALLGDEYKELNHFYLYAREDAMSIGGLKNGMIIAGHTPTINDESVFYNDGKVFRFYDEEKDCVFYNIDCGCVFRGAYPSGKLACLRLDDEEIYYV